MRRVVKSNKPKMYIVRKYILAKSVEEALKHEKKVKPDDIWIDDDWRKEHSDATDTIGFIK